MLKRTGFLVLAAAMCVFSARFVLADDPSMDPPQGEPKAAATQPGDDADEPRTPTGYYRRVAKDVKLTPDQLVKFYKKVAELADKAKEWDEKNGGRLAELNKSFEEAVKAAKKENVDAIKAELKKLLAEKEKALDALREEVMSVLSDEQKALVKEFNFYYGILGRFKAAKVAAEQKDKIRALCKDAFKDFLAAKDDAAVETIKKNLVEKITKDVLTEDQRKLLDAAKKDKDGGKKIGDDSDMLNPPPAKENPGK
ncbi:MAG: hypothetical protein HZA50_08805 [Planctomycetes bacterium]|nr:hypothetical protein [Planctomycetota bacterium]